MGSFFRANIITFFLTRKIVSKERHQKAPLSIQDVHKECKPAQPRKNYAKKPSLNQSTKFTKEPAFGTMNILPNPKSYKEKAA